MLDPQMKRGLLDVCVLSTISRGDSYGYKIIKDMSACIRISESTLYPILRRLEASGCLEAVSYTHLDVYKRQALLSVWASRQ